MHTPEIIETKQVSNEQVSYRIVCCGEKCSEKCKPAEHVCEDSWVTLSVKNDNHEAQLEIEKGKIAERHAKMAAWKEKNGVQDGKSS